MSMNYFFAAFPQDMIDAMEEDNSLIDKYVFEDHAAMETTDVGTAWDVLSHVLKGAGFHAGDFVEDTLSNGGFLMSADELKSQANLLKRYSRDELFAKVTNISDSADLYWLDFYKDDEDTLLEEFDKLIAFYQTAAEKNLGAVHYPA